MTYFNLTNITAANSTLQILQNLNNDLTAGLFSLLFVGVFFIILIINFSYYKITAAGAAATVISTIVAGLLWMTGLLPYWVFIIFIIGTIIWIFMLGVVKD